ncbi:hypothetical protein QF035_002321 [Streptomyces umbrinus]|uniref:Nucleotidyltransferase family protein n=1 Tax=Streptomyces umbrinus TaxID=67370 RepID=A0ABU0SME4_9ACTN|nr:nucleotidyltransferase family protein [Streptomyces umbrinus]MDQ1024739.1 hypothetical protein [Streptomyces umbrinus]
MSTDTIALAHSARAEAWRLLEAISVADPGSEKFDEASRMATCSIDPDILLALAARHRLVPALADFLRRANLMNVMPVGTQHLLQHTLEWNRHKIGVLLSEAQHIAQALSDRGLKVAFNKGIVCQAALYDSRGVRFFSDIDLMVLPGQRADVQHVLLDLGYEDAKTYDLSEERLVDLPREKRLTYRLYPDHLPHFFRIDVGSGIPYLKVDVAFSLTWFGSRWQLPMDEVMADLEHVPVDPDAPRKKLPTLGTAYGFLFLALHLFRECWFQRTIEEGVLRLSQFADIQKFWERSGRNRADEICSLMRKHGLSPAIAWICHHVDMLYGSGITEELGLDSYLDPAWLNSAGAAEGSYLSWQGDMRSRLMAASPLVLTPTGEPPYGSEARALID